VSEFGVIKTKINNIKINLKINMKKIFLLLSVNFSLQAQDTLYSYSFPNGIVTNNIKETPSAYKFYPINSPDLELIIKKREMIKIISSNGDVKKNPDFNPGENVVLKTEPLTGKILIESKCEFKGAICKDLYNAAKQISTGSVDYYIISADESGNSFLTYRAVFGTYFAGDPYTIAFKLNIKFKDGKIKYEYRDFIMILNREKFKSKDEFWGKQSITIDNKNVKSLDYFYGVNARNSDQKSFWIPISNTIRNSIESLLKSCNEVTSNGKSDW
jgi:hypothetical protein